MANAYNYEAYVDHTDTIHLFALENGKPVWGDVYNELTSISADSRTPYAAALDWCALTLGYNDPVADGWAYLGFDPLTEDFQSDTALASVRMDYAACQTRHPVASSAWTQSFPLGIDPDSSQSPAAGRLLEDALTALREQEQDGLPDLLTGKWRVHLVTPGAHYGLEGALTYTQEDADRHGSGLPLVEFYDISQDPIIFPGGQFVSRYYMDTLLGHDGYGTPLSQMKAFSLDLGIPAWTVSGSDLEAISRLVTAVGTAYPAIKGQQEQARNTPILALRVPIWGPPEPVELPQNAAARLAAMQEVVGGDIEPLPVPLFGSDDITIYANGDGIATCQPNRAIYASAAMEAEGYLSQMDFSHVAREGELYTVLFGDLLITGFDPSTGDDRNLTEAEVKTVTDYFTRVSDPGSGMREVIAIQMAAESDIAVSRPSLASEVKASREAAEALATDNEALPRTDPDRDPL